MARAEGDLAVARPLLEEALALCRALGNKESESGNNINLGFLAQAEGDFRAARAYFTDARELGNKKNISYALEGFAAQAAGEEEWEKAALLASAAEHLRALMGLECEPKDAAAARFTWRKSNGRCPPRGSKKPPRRAGQ